MTLAVARRRPPPAQIPTTNATSSGTPTRFEFGCLYGRFWPMNTRSLLGGTSRGFS